MEDVDVVVIGAGVIGLAIARRFALEHRAVIVLEAEAAIGTHTSSRNSEVIHAGLYYQKNSLKARLCVEGREKLYAYCAERHVAFQKIGKLIVAVDDAELPELQGYRAKAISNGVHDLKILEAKEILAMEPEVKCVGGLFSPSTGIIDSHGLMLSYLGDLETCGGWLALKSPVLGGRVESDGLVLDVGGQDPITLKARLVIDAAGLYSQSVARTIQGVPANSVPKRYLARGHYFSLSGKSPFSRLVYPIANSAGLGVHVTLDLGGAAKFGPDVSDWVDSVDYAFDENRREYFDSAIRRYYPGLDSSRLMPGYVGIRPKVAGPSDPAGDFVIQGITDHGLASWVALYGMESPGLTASLAIADYVWEMVSKH